MNRDQSPFRYLPWFVRDAVVWPFRVFVAVAVVFDLVMWRFAANMHGPGPGASDQLRDIPHMIQAGFWSSALTIAILMTIGGIVGTDLERGYYRSFFSKPMSPLWFYAQRFLVGAAVILVTPLVLGAGMALAIHGNMGLSREFMGEIAMGYLLVGGATLLVSQFSSKGWLLVFVVTVMQSLLGQITKLPDVPRWLLTLHRVLPPFHLVSTMGPFPHGGDLRHILIYGSAMVVAALLLLRTRPLGAGITS